MDPFHVTCETCHARLKIRSESVIGQIHACPKCESMVHIVPPPGWVPSTAPAATAAAESPVEMLVAETPVEAPAAAMGSSILVWSIAGASLALVLITGLVVAMWPHNESPPTVAASAPSEPGAASEPAAVEAQAETPQAETVVRDEGDALEADPVEAVSKDPAPPELPEDEVAVVAPAATEPSEPPAATPPAADASNKKPVLKFDPLDFDPAQLSLGGAPAPQPAETSGSVADANAAPVVVVPQDELRADANPAEPAVGDASVTVRVGPGATDVLRPRNVAEQLGLKVESLEVADMPLARFADVVAEIGNVPVTIDPNALAMAGISPRTNVAVQARGTTLDTMLRDVLVKQRLDYQEHDGQVVVVHPNRDARRGVDYEVKDLLAPGAKDATEFSQQIVRFVAPESWHDGAGAGAIRVDGTKLHVDQTSQVQIQILLFCERLRLARGLSLKSKYPAERLSIESPYVGLRDKLGNPSTFTFLPWTRLADVVRRWQESSGVTILVDWEALAKEELAPATPIACSAVNRPWDAALDAVLEPLGLAWWAVDGETIQITSAAKLGALEQIEFYKPPRDRLVVDQVAKGAKHVERDAASGMWIVLAPPDVHRKLAGAFGKTSPQRHDEHDGIRASASPIGTP